MNTGAYIGLMSGTSMDGVDAVIARFERRAVSLDASLKLDYPEELRNRLRAAVSDPGSTGIDEVGELDTWVGECFADAANELLRRTKRAPDTVTAIGSHGQTLRHRPDARHRFTLQIGNPAVIAARTGIETVADFRRADVAEGGEGAPLVPPFHRWLFQSADENRAVLNIGGIANLTVLPAAGGPVTGFDTGPGNTLLDAWIRQHRDAPFDDDGRWAATGDVDEGLLARFLDDAYFAATPPKSTGVEHFNHDWVKRFDVGGIDLQDVQATLAELTAASIGAAIRNWAPGTVRLYICGGGVHNSDLLARLQRHTDVSNIEHTGAAGLDPDWVEAAAFAWLAMRHLGGQAGNLPGVTGARRETILGAHYPARIDDNETGPG